MRPKKKFFANARLKRRGPRQIHCYNCLGRSTARRFCMPGADKHDKPREENRADSARRIRMLRELLALLDDCAAAPGATSTTPPGEPQHNGDRRDDAAPQSTGPPHTPSPEHGTGRRPPVDTAAMFSLLAAPERAQELQDLQVDARLVPDQDVIGPDASIDWMPNCKLDVDVVDTPARPPRLVLTTVEEEWVHDAWLVKQKMQRGPVQRSRARKLQSRYDN